MNQFFPRVVLILSLSLAAHMTRAQKPQTDCNDPSIKSMAEGLKKSYTAKGMMVFQEAMLNMTSMEPTPIAVRMLKGQTYQLIYVGSEHANKMIMEIYDGKDKKLDEKRERGEDYIIYSFTPDKTDVYLVTLYQKKGVRNMCGYFGVMMSNNRTSAPRNEMATPVQAPAQPRVVSQPASKPVKTKSAPVKVTTTPAVTTTPVKTTTTTTTPPPAATTSSPNTPKQLPDNQRPNPNRTRATNEARQGK